MTENYKKLFGGAFCIYHFVDPDTNEQSILLLERGGKYKGGGETTAYGAPGGYIEVETLKEQPRDAAIREFGEEVQKPEGAPDNPAPVIDTITPQRLKLVDTGIDYTAAVPGTDVVGVEWTGFQCELTPEEARTLKDHLHKLEKSPAYAETVLDATRGETKSLLAVSAKDFIAQVDSIPFHYEHEKIVALDVATQLMQTAPKLQIAPAGVANTAYSPKTMARPS